MTHVCVIQYERISAELPSHFTRESFILFLCRWLAPEKSTRVDDGCITVISVAYNCAKGRVSRGETAKGRWSITSAKSLGAGVVYSVWRTWRSDGTCTRIPRPTSPVWSRLDKIASPSPVAYIFSRLSKLHRSVLIRQQPLR